MGKAEIKVRTDMVDINVIVKNTKFNFLEGKVNIKRYTK